MLARRSELVSALDRSYRKLGEIEFLLERVRSGLRVELLDAADAKANTGSPVIDLRVPAPGQGAGRRVGASEARRDAIGRGATALEMRDWIDVIACDERLQPLGYLAWAACGKDPGFSPLGVIDHARRSSHYSAAELASLALEGPPPDAAGLSRRWRHALETAPPLIERRPGSAWS